nr:hypothetical protein [uncultured Methanobrevibacter sp.]
MKFKKSHILLILLISLFLLLSLSAVSAASDSDIVAQDMAIDDIGEIGDIDNSDNDFIDANLLSEGEGNDDPENPENPMGPDDPGTGENEETGAPATLEASNETYSFGDTIKINVSLKDDQGRSINISQEDLMVLCKLDSAENFTNRNFTLDNESKIVFVFEKYKTLSVGNYTVKIIYNKTIDDVEYLFETLVILNITKSDTNLTASDVKVNLGSNIIIPINLTVESNRTLNVYKGNMSVIYIIDGEEYIFNVTNETGGYNITHKIKLLNFTYGIGNYVILIKFLGTDNCNPSNTTITLSILENNTLNANGTIKVNNSTKNVTIPFSVINYNIVNITDENGENTTNLTVNNLTVLTGDLKLVLKYDNGTENVTVEITDFTLEGEEGNYTISFITDLNFTADFYKANLTIIYKNDTLNETSKTVNIKAFAEASIEPVVSEADYQFGEFKFRLVDGLGNPITNYNVTLSGGLYKINYTNDTSSLSSIKLTSDDEGYIILKLSNGSEYVTNDFKYCLPAGKYNVTFINDGFYEFNKTEITVNKINAKIIANNVTSEYGNAIKYTFQVVHAVTGEPIKFASVQFKIVASNINYTSNGTTNISGYYICLNNITLPGNTYNLTLKSIDASLNCSAVKKHITITPRKAVLTAYNRTIYYDSDYSAILKVTDKKTGKVVQNVYVWFRVYISSSKYSDFIGRTDKNGKVYLSTPLAVGKHKIIYKTLDSNYNASSITRYLTVKKASAKFTSSSVSTYYKSGKIFQIKLTNTKNKKAVYGAKMNIKVFISKNKYYNYTGTTDANGLVKFKISYKPGSYKVVVSSCDKGYSASAITRTIKVSKSPIKMAPTSLKVKKGTYFKVKVTSTKTKKVLSSVKVKVKVYTGKKYKTYTIKTNSKGIASLKISQSVGKHKVVLSPGSPTYYSAKALTKTLTVTK